MLSICFIAVKNNNPKMSKIKLIKLYLIDDNKKNFLRFCFFNNQIISEILYILFYKINSMKKMILV